MNRNFQASARVKHAYFAQQLLDRLKANNIPTSPVGLAAAFNCHFNSTVAKPHTVRKWLIGETQPRSETLLLLANWLKVKPEELISMPRDSRNPANKISIEFDFSDQEVISKYLCMTPRQKAVVRLLIKTISEQGK